MSYNVGLVEGSPPLDDDSPTCPHRRLESRGRSSTYGLKVHVVDVERRVPE